ncbi:helix-turn-helix domain-containing protein [Mediterranea massiliensis]|uniref:helix-turn-helix domain-containing protein n=1 Tax=Mediterranea massiliensis TaxID=1841865 RepID=UPI000932DDF9|nr:helix-turn-helix transcriptional regulator [Mediterranea massiliensis]
MNEQQLFIKIGDKIREKRLEKGISQQDLAAKCNFEKANMSRIEAGRTNLTIKTAFKISCALGIKLKDLVDVE